MNDFETETFEDAKPAEVTPAKPKKDPALEIWYCIHCQNPRPKKSMITHDGARVCRDSECVRAAIMEDRYAR